MFRYRSARYVVTVENPRRVSRRVSLAEIDGVRVAADLGVGLVDDGTTHHIRIVLG
jgi:cyclic beta-1,2-glucan synthetase